MSETVKAVDHAAAIAAEYGTYVAIAPIFLNGARAFNAGDPVPVGHVKRGVVNAAQVRETKAEQPATTTNKKG